MNLPDPHCGPDPLCGAAHPFFDENGDKLREECGIFGVLGVRDAAAISALGLHALQHRGQEAVGITSFDGQEFYSRRGIGHVASIFSSSEAIAELPGTMAAGQAIGAFELFTGREPDAARIDAHLRRMLAERQG